MNVIFLISEFSIVIKQDSGQNINVYSLRGHNIDAFELEYDVQFFELMESYPLSLYNSVYGQRDSVPSHNSELLRAFLDDNFSQVWIGTYGALRWPLR